MSVDEGRRRHLHEQLTAAVGPEATATMFELIPPAGAGPATSTDIAELSARMDRGFGHVNHRVDGLEERIGRLEGRMGRLEDGMDRLEDGMGRLENGMDRLEDQATQLVAAVADLSREITGLSQRVETSQHALTADYRGEILAAVTSQTRAVLMAVLTTLLGVAGLAWSFSQLG